MKETDELETPPWLWDQLSAVFNFTVDACATEGNSFCRTYCTIEDSFLTAEGLEDETIWLNPPYSNPGPFLAKAHYWAERGATTIALVKGDPSTKWWVLNVSNKATVFWIPTRIKFYLNGEPMEHAASFPSVLLIYWGINWRPNALAS